MSHNMCIISEWWWFAHPIIFGVFEGQFCAVSMQKSAVLTWLKLLYYQYGSYTQNHTTQHNTTQHNTTQHNTTQHNTTQHNTTQHNTTQYNTIQLCWSLGDEGQMLEFFGGTGFHFSARGDPWKSSLPAPTSTYRAKQRSSIHSFWRCQRQRLLHQSIHLYSYRS
jgi:hypothetical protein